MASSTATVTAGVNLSADASITRQDLQDAIEDMSIGDFSRLHVASTATIPTIGSVAPSSSLVTGELWLDTSVSPPLLKRYNGTTWVPVDSFIGSSAPVYTAIEGMRWFDTTLKLHRVYTTKDSITGWHPVNSGYELWVNDAGADMTVGQIGIPDTAAGTVPRRFTRPTQVKDQMVCVVLMEAITSTSTGVVARVSSGATVTLAVDASTHAVVVGDGLISNASADGNARSVGPLFSDSAPHAGVTQFGQPFGCFAQALTALASGTGTITARLLGQVGTGCTRLFVHNFGGTATQLVSSMTENAWTEVDASTVITNANVPGGSAKNLPMIAAYLNFFIVDDYGGASTDGEMSMSFGRSTLTDYSASYSGRTKSDGTMRFVQSMILVRTSDGSTDEIGNTFDYFLPTSGGTYSSKALFLNGYIY